MTSASVPSHAGWFDANLVHEIERRALPELFQPEPTLTKQEYIEARNFVITTFRQEPTLFLSVTECRRHLSLDVSAVIRIHQFLEYWGLVNYLPQPQIWSAANGSGVLQGCLKRPASTDIGLSARADLFTTGTSNSMPRGSWTHDNTLALLEGLEQFEDRWEDVAAHVGKAPDDCAHRFLRLPIEEPQQPEALLGQPHSPTYSLSRHPSPQTPHTSPSLRSSNTLAPLLIGCSKPCLNPAAVGEGASDTMVDPQLSQFALLSRLIKGTDPPEVVTTAVAASHGMQDAARQMLKAMHERALQHIANEERHMQQLCTIAVETQLQRLEAKISIVDKIAALLQREREQLERGRNQIFVERWQALSSLSSHTSAPSCSRRTPP